MADTTVVYVRQLAGAEDLMFGLGAVSQVREGETVVINSINASTIPYDNTRSVKDVLDYILSKVG